MNIAFDIDGVLTDIEKFQLETGREYFKKKYSKDIVNPNGAGIKEIFACSEREEYEFWRDNIIYYASKYPMRTGCKETIKKILTYISNYKLYVIGSFVFAAISVVLTLYVPILIGEGVDFILDKGLVDFAGLMAILKKMLVVILITALAQWLMNLCNNRITFHVVKDIRTKAFCRLEQVPVKYIDDNAHGDIISRVIADVDQFSDGLLMGFTQLFSGILTIVGTLMFMVSINWKIALVVVVLTPLSLCIARFIANKTYSMFKLQSETRGEMTSLLNEMIGNQKIVQAFGYEKEALERFDEINRRLQGASLRAIFFSSITNPSTRLVNGVVYAAVGVFGAIGAMNGLLSVGQLSSFLSYANQYTKPFNEISGVITELQNSIACAQRIFDLLEEKPQKEEEQDAIVLEEAKGYVSFKQVSFSYTPEKKLIEDFNLNVVPGQKIAIVGPTGCGKTTLINLLMRFYEVTKGEILVDKIPISHMTRSSLRKNYGMVLQDTWLKEGTVWENISMGRKDATKEEIIEAAKAAHCHSFIKRLPKGYDTYLSEDGGNLSQGQKQLICIARIMLSLPPMLILDEATSSIDTRTEMKIQQAFGKLMKGRVSFIVAHRLSTIQDADLILVMQEGNIVEQGNHESLLKQKGFYYQLYYSH